MTTTYAKTSMMIGGEAVEGEGPPLSSWNPTTEELLATVPTASPAQVEDAVAAARAAFDSGPWPRLAPAERAEALDRLAGVFDRRAEELVADVVDEVGTPVTLARTLHRASVTHLRHFAELAARDLTVDLGPDDDGVPSHSLLAYRPAGVAVAISAYNYPLLLSLVKVGAALAAGCTVVLQVPERAPLTGLSVGSAIQEAELPAGVVNVLAGGADVGRQLTARQDVDRISFTGSLNVGRRVMTQAAENVVGVVMELGGKSANILMPGLPLTAETLAPLHHRYLRNAGQGCASPTRLLVHRDELDRFVEASRAVFEAVPVGDPWEEATVTGPLIRPEHRDFVADFIARAVDGGAEVLAGGGKPAAERGWFVNPTMLAAAADSEIAQEEVFGPVSVLLAYDDLDHAVALANDTKYGLAAHIQAPSAAEAVALAPALQAGSIYINGGGALRPDGPFGGFKASGIGREWGELGIREYLEPQHVQWRTP